MASRTPKVGIVLIMLVWLAIFLALPVWAWGSWSGLIAHPARAGAVVVITLSGVACLFTDINLGGLKRADAQGRWLLVPLTVFSLAVAALPAYADRRGLATIDGDAVRYLGLVLLTVGIVLRVGPMFVLGRRFTWPLASQEPYPLQTTGFYRVVRHPSYLGAIVGVIGWVLVFRSAIGLAACLLLIPLFVGIVRKEEAILLSEFGDQYAAYQRRTWRLLPFVY